MTISDDEFFAVRQDWSRRKHLILDQYLKPATAKLRSVSPDRRVFILDGFAGRGRYDDGAAGSPVNMGELADTVSTWTDPVSLYIHNVEPDRESYEELSRTTETWVEKGIVTNHNSSFSDALPGIIQVSRKSPLFAFIDPFRPKHLPFDDMAPLLERAAITELLIVFHTPNVLRVIEQVRPSSKTDEKTRKGSMLRLTSIFGSDRWKRFIQEVPTTETVIKCYAEEIAYRLALPSRDLFICTTAIEVRHGVGLKYHIVFVTRNTHGVFLINDAFAKEKREVYNKSQVAMPGLFAEFADPLDESYLPEKVQRILLNVVGTDPTVVWAYRNLVHESMKTCFGLYSEAEFKQALRTLLAAQTGNRLIGVAGNTLRNGNWKVDDNLRLRCPI